MHTVTWTHDGDADWSQGADWSTGAPPGATDVVLLASPSHHTVIHATGTDEVAGVQGVTDILRVGGGSMQIDGASRFMQGLTLDAGVLAFASGETVVRGEFKLRGGTLKLGQAATLDLQHYTSINTSFNQSIEISGPGTLKAYLETCLEW